MCAQSCLTLCNSMDVAHQTPLSMEFPRQEYWSWWPFSTPGDLPDQRLNPHLLCLLHYRQILYRWATKEFQLLKSVVLISAMQQSESAICIFMYCLPLGPPITTSHHPQSTPSHLLPDPITAEHQAELLHSTELPTVCLFYPRQEIGINVFKVHPYDSIIEDFIYFLLLSSIPRYRYTIFFCSSVDGHLGYFHFSALWIMFLWTFIYKFL